MGRASTPPRHRFSVDERRTQLLTLGLELFGDRDYESVSIDEIAAAAGISKGLLYHYFGNKRGYYFAVVEMAAAQLVEAIEPDESLPAPHRAQAGLEAYLDFVSHRAGAFTALMSGGSGVDGEIAQLVQRTRHAIADRMLEGLGLTQPRPVFRLAAMSWIGSVERASLDWLATKDVPREVVVTLLLRTLQAMVMTAIELDPQAGVTLDE